MNQGPFDSVQLDFKLVDPGVRGAEIQFVQWLVPVSARLMVGERIAEIVSCHTVIHLQSPVHGLLSELLVSPGQVLAVGDVLCRIEVEIDPLS